MNRGRAKPSPAPPGWRGAAASEWSPPPVSRGGGRGGETGSGEGQALPRTPGLPRRGGFPAELSPMPPGGRGAPASRQEPPPVRRDGIGEAAGSGEGLAVPRTPVLPRRGRFPAAASLVRRREREEPAQGWALFSATPPVRGDAAASRRMPPLGSCRGGTGGAAGSRAGSTLLPTSGLPRRWGREGNGPEGNGVPLAPPAGRAAGRREASRRHDTERS